MNGKEEKDEYDNPEIWDKKAAEINKPRHWNGNSWLNNKINFKLFIFKKGCEISIATTEQSACLWLIQENPDSLSKKNMSAWRRF